MEQINKSYNLPQEFYKYIEPYIRRDDKRKTISDLKTLFELWDKAIVIAKEFPNMRESIAEWTVSSVASSELLKDKSLEAIHYEFGSLEVGDHGDDSYDVSAMWSELAKDIRAAGEDLGVY